MLCELLHLYRDRFNEFLQRLGSTEGIRFSELLLESDAEINHAAGFASAIKEVLLQLLSAEHVTLSKVRVVLTKRHPMVLAQWLPTTLASYKRHGSLWSVVSDDTEDGTTWTAATSTLPVVATSASQPVSEQLLAVWHIASALTVGLTAVGEVLSTGISVCEVITEAACELFEAVLVHGRELVGRAWAEVRYVRSNRGLTWSLGGGGGSPRFVVLARRLALEVPT